MAAEHDTQTGYLRNVYIKDSLSLVERLIAELLNELFIPGTD